jgi:hypothetical protein
MGREKACIYQFRLKHYKGPSMLETLPVYELLSDQHRKRITECQINIERKLNEVKYAYYEIGLELSTAKNIVGHGNFQCWIEETWKGQLPYSTAACCLAIYEKFKDFKESVMLLPLGLLQQMKQDSFPDVINQLILDNPEAFQKANLGDIKQLLQDFKSGTVSLDILQGQARVRHSRTAQRIAKFGVGELRKAVGKVRHYVGKLRTFFPPAENERWSDDDRIVAAHNGMADAINAEIFDDRLLKEIKALKAELNQLEAEIEERQGFWRERLVERDGVVEKEMMSNL